MTVRFSSKGSRKISKVVAVTMLSLMLAMTSFSVAFGDFELTEPSKVLGVGRIQSSVVEVPVAVDTKFSTYNDSKTEQIAELSAPVDRAASEVEIVVPEVVAPEPAPSSGSSSEAVMPNNTVPEDEAWMLEWIINRESSGNPNAVSRDGRYLGIGQLQRHHYEVYVGMTWEEAKGNYDVQLQAMLCYIDYRYKSITAAYNFWQANGWY